MNDLETRLAEMLHERAAVASPDDRLGDVLAGSAQPVRRAWWPAVVAAAAAVLLVVGGVWLAKRADTSDRVIPGANSTLSDLAAIPAPALSARMLPISLATDDGWFIWGGRANREWLSDGAYYDTSSGKWTSLPESPVRVGINEYASGTWTGHDVVVVAGGSQIRIAAFDPSAFAWRSIAVPGAVAERWPTVEKRYVAANTAWIAGRLVLYFPSFAGRDYQPTVFVLDPDDGEWSIGSASPVPVVPEGDSAYSGAVLASEAELLVLDHVEGTHDPCPGATTVSIYDVSTDTWRLAPLPRERWTPGIVAWTGSALLLAGGEDCFTTQTDRTVQLDPRTGDWSAVAPVPSTQIHIASSARLSSGEVVNVDISGLVFVYDPTTDQWWAGPRLGPDERGVGGVGLVLFDRELYLWSPQVAGVAPSGTLFHLTIPPVADWPSASPTTWDERSPVATITS